MPQLETIKQDIITALDNDTLVLPTLPEVALRVREVAENDDSGIPDLTEVISQDAALSARIIRVVNSPLLRGGREIRDLGMAIGRLGMNYTANLATSLAMEQMFQATSPQVDRRMRAVWQRSTEVAGICHVLAQHFTDLKPDQATLAGIIHLIGALPLLRYAEEHEDGGKVQGILDEIIEALHPTIGYRILQKWDFPQELQIVPREFTRFDRELPKPDYADLVMVATLQSVAGSDHPYNDLDWTTISAFNRLGLDPEVDISESEDLSNEMEAAMALLSAE